MRGPLPESSVGPQPAADDKHVSHSQPGHAPDSMLMMETIVNNETCATYHEIWVNNAKVNQSILEAL